MKGTPHVRHQPVRFRAVPETPFTSLTQEDPSQEVFLDLLQLLPRSPHVCGPRWPRATHRGAFHNTWAVQFWGYSPTRDWTNVPYTGRQILNHWIARKVPQQNFNLTSFQKNSVQFSSVAQSCTSLCISMNCSTPGLPVHHQLLESTQTHVVESVMPSSHLILCCPLHLLPSIFPSIRVLSNESALCIRWPKYWNFSFNISPSNEHPGLISFRMDWLDLLAV